MRTCARGISRVWLRSNQKLACRLLSASLPPPGSCIVCTEVVKEGLGGREETHRDALVAHVGELMLHQRMCADLRGGAMIVRGGRGAAILCAENLCCSLVAATRPPGKFSVMRGHTRTSRPHTDTTRREVWHGSSVGKVFPPAWAPKSRVHNTNFATHNLDETTRRLLDHERKADGAPADPPFPGTPTHARALYTVLSQAQAS